MPPFGVDLDDRTLAILRIQCRRVGGGKRNISYYANAQIRKNARITEPQVRKINPTTLDLPQAESHA